MSIDSYEPKIARHAYLVCCLRFRLIFLISFIKVDMNNAKKCICNDIVADYERNLQAERNKMFYLIHSYGKSEHKQDSGTPSAD